jgi:hypothetical protein
LCRPPTTMLDHRRKYAQQAQIDLFNLSYHRFGTWGSAWIAGVVCTATVSICLSPASVRSGAGSLSGRTPCASSEREVWSLRENENTRLIGNWKRLCNSITNKTQALICAHIEKNQCDILKIVIVPKGG